MLKLIIAAATATAALATAIVGRSSVVDLIHWGTGENAVGRELRLAEGYLAELEDSEPKVGKLVNEQIDESSVITTEFEVFEKAIEQHANDLKAADGLVATAVTNGEDTVDIGGGLVVPTAAWGGEVKPRLLGDVQILKANVEPMKTAFTAFAKNTVELMSLRTKVHAAIPRARMELSVIRSTARVATAAEIAGIVERISATRTTLETLRNESQNLLAKDWHVLSLQDLRQARFAAEKLAGTDTRLASK